MSLDHKIQALWSECGDLNSGPLGPEPSALPSALHPVFDSFAIILSVCSIVKQNSRDEWDEKEDN